MKYDFRPVGVAAFLLAALAAAIFMILEDARSVYVAGAAQISTASAASTVSQLISGTANEETEAGEDDIQKDPEDAVYEFLIEDEYTDIVWDGFFELYPQYADVEGQGLRKDYEMMFLPYYSQTLSAEELEEHGIGKADEGSGGIQDREAVFGGWEIAFFDEAQEAYVSMGVYACARIINEETDGAMVDNQYRWFAFNEPESSTFYPSFSKHELSASVINGDTLRIHIKVDVTDSSGGTYLFVTYQLHTEDQRINNGLFLQPFYNQNNDDPNEPRVGTVTYNKYTNIGSSSPGRSLEIDAYWDISGEDLEKFMEDLNGNTLYWACGSSGYGSNSIHTGSISVSNLANAAAQASCSHASKKYTQISGDTSKHKVSCASCGTDLGTSVHQKDGNGRCSLCGYVFTVSGKLIYVLNGRTESESYTADPGSRLKPKSFTGYRQPGEVAVPSNGGDIRITYEPVSYSLRLGTQTHTLRYDDRFMLPEIEKKGHIHEGYHFVS